MSRLDLGGTIHLQSSILVSRQRLWVEAVVEAVVVGEVGAGTMEEEVVAEEAITETIRMAGMAATPTVDEVNDRI